MALALQIATTVIISKAHKGVEVMKIIIYTALAFFLTIFTGFAFDGKYLVTGLVVGLSDTGDSEPEMVERGRQKIEAINAQKGEKLSTLKGTYALVLLEISVQKDTVDKGIRVSTRSNATSLKGGTLLPLIAFENNILEQSFYIEVNGGPVIVDENSSTIGIVYTENMKVINKHGQIFVEVSTSPSSIGNTVSDNLNNPEKGLTTDVVGKSTNFYSLDKEVRVLFDKISEQKHIKHSEIIIDNHYKTEGSSSPDIGMLKINIFMDIQHATSEDLKTEIAQSIRSCNEAITQQQIAFIFCEISNSTTNPKIPSPSVQAATPAPTQP